jgi:hypothetical protein
MAGLTPPEAIASPTLVYLLTGMAAIILIAVGLAVCFLKKKKDSVPKIDEEMNIMENPVIPIINLTAIKKELKEELANRTEPRFLKKRNENQSHSSCNTFRGSEESKNCSPIKESTVKKWKSSTKKSDRSEPLSPYRQLKNQEEE